MFTNESEREEILQVQQLLQLLNQQEQVQQT